MSAVIPLAFIARPWTPKRLSGMQGLWLPANAHTDTGGTPAVVGQTIRRIAEPLTGWHLERSTGTLQPTLQYLNGADASNGMAFQFDGVDDWMQTLTSRSLAPNRFFFGVLRLSAGADSTPWYFGGNWHQNGTSGVGYYPAPNMFRLEMQNSPGAIAFNSASVSAATEYRVIAQTGSSATAGKLWVNGALIALTHTGATTQTPSSGNWPFTMGVRGGAELYAKGRIGSCGFGVGDVEPYVTRLDQWMRREHNL